MSAESLANLSIPGGWRERVVEVGERRLTILAPADPDEFVNQLADADESALPRMRADPYWAQVWTAALPLAAAVDRATWSAATRVLELGCGIGVPGLIACVRGWQTTFSDYVDEAVALALENARRLGIPPSQVAGMTLDWRDPPPRQFERIIASDVIYEERLHRPLLKAISGLLAEGGEAWIADPGRSLCSDFLDAARRRDWQVSLFDRADQFVETPVLGEFRRIVLRRL